MVSYAGALEVWACLNEEPALKDTSALDSYLRGLAADRSGRTDTWGLTWNGAGKPALALPEAKRGKALMELNSLLHRALVRRGADVNWTTLLVGSSAAVVAPGPPQLGRGWRYLLSWSWVVDFEGKLVQICSSRSSQVPQ